MSQSVSCSVILALRLTNRGSNFDVTRNTPLHKSRVQYQDQNNSRTPDNTTRNFIVVPRIRRLIFDPIFASFIAFDTHLVVDTRTNCALVQQYSDVKIDKMNRFRDRIKAETDKYSQKFFGASDQNSPSTNKIADNGTPSVTSNQHHVDTQKLRFEVSNHITYTS